MRGLLLFCFTTVTCAFLQYKVVSWYHNMTKFEELVNQELRNGWVLQGGLSVSVHGGRGNNLYAQAMTKSGFAHMSAEPSAAASW